MVLGVERKTPDDESGDMTGCDACNFSGCASKDAPDIREVKDVATVIMVENGSSMRSCQIFLFRKFFTLPSKHIALASKLMGVTLVNVSIFCGKCMGSLNLDRSDSHLLPGYGL